MKKHLISSLLLTFALFLYIVVCIFANYWDKQPVLGNAHTYSLIILIFVVILSWLNYYTNNEKKYLLIPLYMIFAYYIINFFVQIINIIRLVPDNINIPGVILLTSMYLLIIPAIISTAIGLFKER